MSDTTINVTFGGLSHDLRVGVPYEIEDEEVRRLAAEELREQHNDFDPSALNHYVVDRFNTPQGGRKIYLRPKVPFGA